MINFANYGLSHIILTQICINYFYIISAVTSYRNEGYSDYNKRHEYLYPVNENESENDSENDDYEYDDEEDEEDELSSVDRNIYQTNCKLIDVVLRDTKIINDSVKGVECEVRAIGYNLHLCFVFDPKRLFKDNKVAYWHDVDVNRKIAFLFTITYKTSLYIYNNAAELNRFNNLNVIGFQTNDSAKKVLLLLLLQIIENYKCNNNYYHGLGSIYPIANCIKILLSNDESLIKNLENDVINYVRQYIPTVSEYANIEDNYNTLNDYITLLKIAEKCKTHSYFQDAVSYFLTPAEKNSKYNGNNYYGIIYIFFIDVFLSLLISKFPNIDEDYIEDVYNNSKLDYLSAYSQLFKYNKSISNVSFTNYRFIYTIVNMKVFY